jgi:hypothetical protein
MTPFHMLSLLHILSGSGIVRIATLFDGCNSTCLAASTELVKYAVEMGRETSLRLNTSGPRGSKRLDEEVIIHHELQTLIYNGFEAVFYE